MIDWRKVTVYLHNNGMNYTKITEKLNSENVDANYNNVKWYGRTHKDIPELNEEEAALCARILECDISPTTNAKPTKIDVVQNFEPNIIDNEWDGCTTITFGLMGDTQMGSKYSQITLLHNLYSIYARRGITDVYHTGDITDGLKMRKGHEYELYVTSADEMRDDVVKHYPKFNGITTHFITGNHDASIYKLCGYDIGRAIAEKRPDFDYLGMDCAVVKLTPNCTLELRHPWDGTAYATSYKPQKMIEAMEADSKPNILAIGHYHKAEYIFHRNVHCFQTACLQSQTPFTRGKGISVNMGGWIITIKVDSDGHIKSIIPEFVPFYHAVKDDYKNWR